MSLKNVSFLYFDVRCQPRFPDLEIQSSGAWESLFQTVTGTQGFLRLFLHNKFGKGELCHRRRGRYMTSDSLKQETMGSRSVQLVHKLTIESSSSRVDRRDVNSADVKQYSLNEDGAVSRRDGSVVAKTLRLTAVWKCRRQHDKYFNPSDMFNIFSFSDSNEFQRNNFGCCFLLLRYFV